MTRFPLDQLLVTTDLGVSCLPRRLGVSSTTVKQAATAGLTDRQADLWACRLGLHPGTVWPAWWETPPEEAPAGCDVPRGRGSVTSYRTGWRVRVYAGRDPAGRKRYLTRRASTLDEAERLRALMLAGGR